MGSLGGWLSQTKAQVSVMPVRLIAGTVATCVSSKAATMAFPGPAQKAQGCYLFRDSTFCSPVSAGMGTVSTAFFSPSMGHVPVMCPAQAGPNYQ